MARRQQAQVERAIRHSGAEPEHRCRSCRVAQPPERLNANGRCAVCRVSKQTTRRARKSDGRQYRIWTSHQHREVRPLYEAGSLEAGDFQGDQEQSPLANRPGRHLNPKEA